MIKEKSRTSPFFLPLRALYFTIPTQSLNLQGGIVNVKSKKDYGIGDT